jgi:hypothetical protein
MIVLVIHFSNQSLQRKDAGAEHGRQVGIAYAALIPIELWMRKEIIMSAKRMTHGTSGGVFFEIVRQG